MKKPSRFFLTLVILFFSLPAYPKEFSIYKTYSKQALDIYKKMNLDERIGQLLMPSYVLLANAVSKNSSLCQKDVNTPNISKNKLVTDCGLDQIKKYHLGAVLTGGGPYFNAPSLENWLWLNNLANEQHRLGSPQDPLLLMGNDAIHGNMHVQGAVIFPHNIGLGVTHDPALVQEIGYLVGQDSLASGFNWIYMPTVAVAQDLRWGRVYESFSQDPNQVKILTEAYILGFQNIQNNKILGTLATAKHFIGDGATKFGLDEGDDEYQGNESNFWKINGRGYEGALQADVGSIMVSYNAIEGDNTRMHFGGKWNIINQIKNEGIIGSDGKLYRFQGLMVSDWNGPTRAAYFYNKANHTELTLAQVMAKSINAGVDIIMLGQGDAENLFDPNSLAVFSDVGQVFNAIKSAYKQGLISEKRMQDAVTRILAVKIAMDSQPPRNYALLQEKERKLALRAAEESLVLLKNENNSLPLTLGNIRNIIFVGDTNDLGLQNGGWTINWQGQKSDQYFTGKDKISSGAITLEEGIKSAFKNKQVNYYNLNKRKNNLPSTLNNKDTIAIALVSEVPYAEFMGDIANPDKMDEWYKLGAINKYNNYLGPTQNNFLGLMYNPTEAKTLDALRKHGIKVITIVYSGRPLILSEGDIRAPLINSDAVIAAFLPGTLGGQAISNAIFGYYKFRSANAGRSNTLTFPWPRNMRDVTEHFKNGSLFPIGYGLQGAGKYL